MSLYDIAAGLKPLDLGQTLGRLDAMQANRLQGDALRAQLADREATAAAFRQFGPAAARGDETALSALAGIQPGYSVAAPQLREIRQNRDFNALFPGGATQAAPPAGGATVGIAPRSPNATPAALPGLAGAPATAAAIPGAELRMIPRMGHDLPPALYDVFIDAIVAAASRAK